MHNGTWPIEGGCLWGPWMARTSRKGKNPPTQYRQCVHPQCYEVQIREVKEG